MNLDIFLKSAVVISYNSTLYFGWIRIWYWNVKWILILCKHSEKIRIFIADSEDMIKYFIAFLKVFRRDHNGVYYIFPVLFLCIPNRLDVRNRMIDILFIYSLFIYEAIRNKFILWMKYIPQNRYFFAQGTHQSWKKTHALSEKPRSLGSPIPPIPNKDALKPLNTIVLRWSDGFH